MSISSWATVTAIAPELTSVAVGTQTAIMADVNAEVVDSGFPSTEAADRVRKYLAAHLATLALRGGTGAGGPVIGEAVGSISRQYAVFSPMGSDALLDSSAYGKEVRRLLRLLVIPRVGMVV